LRPGRYVKEQGGSIIPVSPEDGRLNFLEDEVKVRSFESVPDEGRGGMWVKPSFQRKTKIVCTIGPTSNTKEMIWKLAAEGMNVARLNMSHGDHASHKKVIDLVREFNKEAHSNVIALMLDTKVCLCSLPDSLTKLIQGNVVRYPGF
jgi:pyruvate kinase